jgi:hypothetical protein
LVLQDISRCALSSGFAREQEDARSAEHRKKESAAIGGSDASRVDGAIRGYVIGLAARNADIEDLPVTRVTQIGS